MKSKQEKVELQEKIDACQTKIAEDETMHNEEKEKLQMQITQLEAEKEQKILVFVGWKSFANRKIRIFRWSILKLWK